MVLHQGKENEEEVSGNLKRVDASHMSVSMVLVFNHGIAWRHIHTVWHIFLNKLIVPIFSIIPINKLIGIKQGFMQFLTLKDVTLLWQIFDRKGTNVWKNPHNSQTSSVRHSCQTHTRAALWVTKEKYSNRYYQSGKIDFLQSLQCQNEHVCIASIPNLKTSFRNVSFNKGVLRWHTWTDINN